MRTLVLTVGGATAPLVTSILHTPRADEVIFVCSEDDPTTGRRGSYTQVGEIAEAANLAASDYRVVRVPADEPDRVLEIVGQLLHESAERGEVIADFTGGTKSMSAGLLLATASRPTVSVRVVTGARQDLTRVRDGMEFVQEVTGVHAQWAREQVEEAWRTHRYADAARVLERVGRLTPELRRLLLLSRAFANWDLMLYAEAAEQLRSLARFVQPWIPEIAVLERFHSGKEPPRKRDEALALTDVLNVAERRERQGLWDVSILLRYRVLEWVEQWSLKYDHQIDPSDVRADAPESVRSLAHPDSRGRLVLGLEAGWEALERLGGPLAELAADIKWLRRDVSATRNASVLAHGITPLTKADSERVRELMERIMVPFWKHSLGTSDPPLPQLPREIGELTG